MKAENEIIGYCDDCGSAIKAGDEYLEVEGMMICQDCVYDYTYVEWMDLLSKQWKTSSIPVDDPNSKDNRLGFAINKCRDDLEEIVADLPRWASDEEITKAINQTKDCMGALMSDVRRIECELENKPINLENMTVDFFNKIAKAGREA